MAKINLRTDAPFSAPWATAVGKLILNFSVVEAQTYLWLVQMTLRSNDLEQLARTPFKKRQAHLLDLIESNAFSNQWKERAVAMWEEALELAHLRNRVAHNPITFGWNDPDEKGDPDTIGVPDFSNRSTGPFLTLAQLNSSINAIAALAPRLDASIRKWCVIRDSRDDAETRAVVA